MVERRLPLLNWTSDFDKPHVKWGFFFIARREAKARMVVARGKILLVVLPILLLVLAAGGARRLWEKLTQPAADQRRDTRAVLPPDDLPRRAAPEPLAADVQPRDMPRIEPGTVIGSTPPEGWSHVVLHGVPRVAAGDVDKVPRSLARLVAMFHLTILADVEADVEADATAEPRNLLRRVAIGLATDVGGREMIVSTSASKALGAELGFVERSSLAGNEASLAQAVQVARTPTMLLFDATAIQRIDDQNRRVLHRHALLVLPTDGRLATLVWALEPDEADKYHLVDGKIRLLPENLEEDRKLYVDAGRFVLGLPAQEAFALVDLPPGRALVVTPELRAAAISPLQTPQDARRLERLLGEAVCATGDPGGDKRHQ